MSSMNFEQQTGSRAEKPILQTVRSSFHIHSESPKLDNACVNRDAATRTVVGLVESDTMGGTTIRRLIGHKDLAASVQRFVIQTAE